MFTTVPFMVEPVHEVKPDLKKLEHDSFSVNPIYADHHRTHYQNEKLAVLQQPQLNAFCVAADWLNNPALFDCVRQLLERQPGWSAASLSQAAQYFIALQPSFAQRWHQLALQLQEDLVVMRQTSSCFAPALLHVCFPSGWDPATKAGADLAQVHAPVADHSRLLAGTKGIANVMVTKGPFVRYVWSLSASDQLSQHPIIKREFKDTENQLYYRCERQITLPLPEFSCSVFLIRVFVVPLAHAANTPERCQLMLQSLKSMSAATVQYKGLTALLPSAITWLESPRP